MDHKPEGLLSIQVDLVVGCRGSCQRLQDHHCDMILSRDRNLRMMLHWVRVRYLVSSRWVCETLCLERLVGLRSVKPAGHRWRVMAVMMIEASPGWCRGPRLDQLCGGP